ncbi:MAG: helix-turn-helix transcriptional regulator [Clostridia bacterium]|nr:helix-turn-helix transcriptional regulator [Clostridia bacterium]
MQGDYSYEGENLFYKHEISHNLPRDAYSMHSHNMYELLYFVSGDATHVIEDRQYKLKKGDLVLIRPSKYHFIRIDSDCDYERYDILFSPRTKNIDGLDLLESTPEIINLEEYPMATEIIKKTDFYYKRFSGEDFERILTGLLCELFYLLSVTPATENTDAPKVSSKTLSRALTYINDNLTTLDGVEEVANSCFITEGYLFRLFKEELRQTPAKYIVSKKLLLAERMISNGEGPASVYEKCGFNDYTTFYRNYKSYFGHPPSRSSS